MPINFGQYVYKPQPLQDWNYGQALSDLGAAKRDQQRINETGRHNKAFETETTAARNDLNTRFAAEFAAARSKEEQEMILARHKRQLEAIQAGVKSSNEGMLGDARAHGAVLAGEGGDYSESPGAGGLPDFRFAPGQMPGRQPMDIDATRQSIFGGGPTPTPGGFDMRSNVGPASSPLGGRNPFEALPGASAAAMPQAPTPQQTTAPQAPPQAPMNGSAQLGVPEGPQLPGVGFQVQAPQIPMPQLQMNGSAQLGAPEGPPLPYSQEQPPAEAPPEDGPQLPPEEEPLQLTGPNPYNAPAFDPYRVSTSERRRENELRMLPFRQGMVDSTPERFQGAMKRYQKGLPGLGFSPEQELKLTHPYLNETTGLWRSQLNAEGQAGRLALQEGAAAGRAADRQIAQDQKLRDFAARESKKILDSESLTATKKKVAASRGIYDLLADAVNNPQSAAAVVEQVYYMRNTGVMTDADYKRAEGGIQSVWHAIKTQGLKKWLDEHGGLHPENAELIRRTVEIGLRTHRGTMASARDRLDARRRSASNEVEREEYASQIRGFFDEEYWPDDVAEGNTISPDYVNSDGSLTKRAERQRASEQQQPAGGSGDNLGVGTLPRTLDGSGGGPRTGVTYKEPTAGSTPVGKGNQGSKVPVKPPRRPPTEAELSGKSEAELMQMLEDAATAPAPKK